MSDESIQDMLRREQKEKEQRAYDLQIQGGVAGAARWTAYGIIAVGIAHYTWPLFRRQTLAIKGFLVSSATMVGLMIGADDYLLQYESHLRKQENNLRRQARNALAREGKLASEIEIRRWKETHFKKAAEDAALVSDGLDTSSKSASPG